MIDTTKLLNKGVDYRFAPGGAVTDRMLLEIATQYENTVSRKMVSLTPEQIEKRFPGDEPILETTKYDGEGVFVSFDANREIFAFNAPSGRVRMGLPVLKKLAEKLAAQKIQKALFRAELYIPNIGSTPKRPGIADVISVSFNGTAEELGTLRLVMLDVIMLDGKDHRPNQNDFAGTWELLGKLFGADETAPFHRACGTIKPEKELASVFSERIKAGQEGLVVRRLQRPEITKIKPHLSIDAVVIGYVEGELEDKYGVTSLLTALCYPQKDGDGVMLQTFCRVGSGFTDQQREELLATFSALKIADPLAMTDSDGRTVHFVKPVHIVEVHGEDLVAVSSKDKENRTQVFTMEDDRYVFAGLAPFPRLTFATFNRIRADKTLAAGGARVEQALPNTQRPVMQVQSSSDSATIRREVYVKADAVRKLVVIKTGAENAVPYMVYWTDYSAKRKDPLKVSVECANTESRAMALAQRLIDENVTKGFLLWNGEDASAAAPTEAADAEPAKPKKPRAKKTTAE